MEEAARRGDPQRFHLPRPMLGRPRPDFSLSGLKTALRVEAERIAPLSEQDVCDLCASFQAAVTDTVVDRTRTALRDFQNVAARPTALVAAGGGRGESDHAARLAASGDGSRPQTRHTAAGIVRR